MYRSGPALVKLKKKVVISGGYIVREKKNRIET